MLGMSTHVTFDEHNPNDKRKGAQHIDGPEAALDYSPLPRLTARSLCMGALVSMGGLIFGYVSYSLGYA
jgi:MFS transporter, SP family, sugar:H+ symporter